MNKNTLSLVGMILMSLVAMIVCQGNVDPDTREPTQVPIGYLVGFTVAVAVVFTILIIACYIFAFCQNCVNKCKKYKL